jgi:cobyrinic acid a,c-diamide synthase
MTKGIVVAGLAGGSGKSVASVGLASLWRRRGKTVAPFKKGPDYIDAGWLQRAADAPCYNLDPYLMSAEQITDSFASHAAGADIVLVEGNRGLFDGVTAQAGYSTADLAFMLDLPVLLVVNCTKTTRTVAAMVLGCQQFAPELTIAGVILNQVATSRQHAIIVEAVTEATGIQVVGAIPRLPVDIFPMRHLGMIPTQEYPELDKALTVLADTVERGVDLDSVEKHASELNLVKKISAPAAQEERKDVRLGVIQDSAFQFYYPDNLEALARAGANLVFIDALADRELPPLDGLYIGGGFPETSAAALAENSSFRDSVRRAAMAGLPIYAECGGLIYLGESIDYDGTNYPLAGVFPVRFGLSNKPQAHGYSQFVVERKNPFYPVGSRVKGHEFRYSTTTCNDNAHIEFAVRMERGTGFMDGVDGLTIHNVLALYTHVHAVATPEWAPLVVKRCRLSLNE